MTGEEEELERRQRSDTAMAVEVGAHPSLSPKNAAQLSTNSYSLFLAREVSGHRGPLSPKLRLTLERRLHSKKGNKLVCCENVDCSRFD